MKTKGFVHKYEDNVDTDVIIPARYLNTAKHEELAKHCMEDIDKEFVNKVKVNDIMVAGFNFGCGSSREHAPIAIKASGISCVIAKTFARIFYRNSINIGLPIIECPKACERIEANDEVEIDFDSGIITNLTKNETYQGEPFPDFIKEIIQANGLLNSISKGNNMNKKITVIKGDGIGPEIVTEAMKVLDKVASKYGHTFEYNEVLAGGCAIDAYGTSLPKSTLDACMDCDSVLLGAVGGPKWDNVDKSIRPEAALLGIRKAMGLYSNLRPAKIFPQLADASPLKPEIVKKGIDLLVVRELIGGVYFGERVTEMVDGEMKATDVMSYSEHEIRRVAKIAFETAMKRNKKVTSIDKANVLDTSRLWRKVMEEVAKDYPEVTYSNMLVDNTAMQLVKDPSQFDVVVTENMFGDILSDEASMITGSIGLIPSSSLGETSRGMYEPIHGSAPDIAGLNIANPIGTILSAAMMLKYSFDMSEESQAIEDAVMKVLNDGYRCGDIMSEGCTKVNCDEMGTLIADNI